MPPVTPRSPARKKRAGDGFGRPLRALGTALSNVNVRLHTPEQIP
ncbi:hypothetical protein ABT246_24815 [Streptomyces sp. NPDC001553]